LYWIGIPLLLILIIIVFMLKTAFENNIELHQLKLAGNNKKMRIFFISDTHARKIDERMIRSIKEPIDAVIIGGDFVDKRTKETTIHENLALLTSLGPTYFIWGNNDREKGEEWLLRIFTKYGVTVVSNDAVVLSETQEKIWLSAINDTTVKNYYVDEAFRKVGEDDKVIFVSHNPEIFTNVRKKYRANLMMGGHLHGGQIRVGRFGIHPHGSYKEREGCMTLVSNGYGTTLVPLRLFAKPECHVIEIIFEEKTTIENVF